MNNGYYAVALDEKSSNAVKKYSTMDVVVGDHITLAYKPDNKTFKKLNKLCGKKVDAYINQIRANKNIEALWVDDMFLTELNKRLKRVDSGTPHITISHKKDFKSGDANSMFKDPGNPQWLGIDHELGYLKGEVKWIPFKEKK
tara:strand:- start:186 stop:614 length:429 start_codon:yes stop_codon:yes gene_type:complete